MKPLLSSCLHAAVCLGAVLCRQTAPCAQDPGILLQTPALATPPSPLQPTPPPDTTPTAAEPFSLAPPEPSPSTAPSDDTPLSDADDTPEEAAETGDVLPNPHPETGAGNRHFWESTVPAGASASLSSLHQLTEYSALQIEGPLQLRLQLNTALVADDNITLESKNKKKDLLLSVGPSASALFGRDDTAFRLSLNYAGAAVGFLKHSNQKSYDQIGNLSGSWNGQKLRVTFRGGIQRAQTTANDPGDRVSRRIYYGGVHFAYALGEKLSSEWSADATRADFPTLLGSKEYRTQSFLQYQWTPKTRIGIGNTFGLLLPDKGERQTYAQGLARAQYTPTAKVTLDLQAGADIRRYRQGRTQSSTPVFSASASWAATPRTQISLEGRRRIFASSALESQNYRVTGVSTTIQHILAESLATGVSTGYEHASYSSTRISVRSNRRDEYGFVRLYMNWAAYRRLSLGSFYELSRNFSTGIQSRQFTRNRIGISANFNF